MSLLRTYTPLACPELGTPRVTGKVLAYDISGGKTLAIPHAPNYDVAPTPAAIVKKAMNAIANLEAARKRARENANLSQLGRQAQVEPIRLAAALAIDAAKVELADYVTTVDQWEVKTYAPPALNAADTVGGLVDMELRTWIRSATGKERTDALKSLATEPRFLEAVVRSPTNLAEISTFATATWRDRIDETHPDAPKITLTREAIEWAEVVLPHLETAAKI